MFWDSSPSFREYVFLLHLFPPEKPMAWRPWFSSSPQGKIKTPWSCSGKLSVGRTGWMEDMLIYRVVKGGGPRGGVSLMFPKVPQSSLGILRVLQLPPPLEHPPLKNPIIDGRNWGKLGGFSLPETNGFEFAPEKWMGGIVASRSLR